MDSSTRWQAFWGVSSKITDARLSATRTSTPDPALREGRVASAATRTMTPPAGTAARVYAFIAAGHCGVKRIRGGGAFFVVALARANAAPTRPRTSTRAERAARPTRRRRSNLKIDCEYQRAVRKVAVSIFNPQVGDGGAEMAASLAPWPSVAQTRRHATSSAARGLPSGLPCGFRVSL
jgi:hypothetical protein